MASSFEKSVKGATKIKAAPPKTKYIEHILVATHAGEAGVGEVFRTLQYRLRDSTWTVVFKSLITVHLMIREGSLDATLSFLAKHRNMLAVSVFSDAQTQGRNIRHYSNYLTERGRAFRETKCDWVRTKETRLEKLTVEKGLLRETEVVQHQLTALLKCDVMDNEPENEITITVFRLLVLDLLALFQVLNQAMINILGHFFEMAKSDAERAMDVYRTFTRQTDFVVQYLTVARQYEHHTRVEVPKLKHAPVNLGRQLEEYLKDPDFEIHRRQYLAELDVKKATGGSSSIGSKLFKTETSVKLEGPKSSAGASTSATKKPEGNLIDFFESIETKQQPMAVQPQPTAAGMNPWGVVNNGPFPTQQMPTNGFAAQPTGFAAQPTGFASNSPFQQQPNGFGQQQFPGAGFGAFSPQQSFQPSTLSSIPQESVASFQTGATGFQGGLQPGQQVTNPFRQSMLVSQQTGSPFPTATPQQRPSTSQSTNPFARSSPQGIQPFGAPSSNSPFQSAAPQQQPPQATPLVAMPTGTNPFAKNFAPSGAQPQQRPVTAGALISQPTGSTNPFRQGAFVNHQTGMGWQHNQQPLGGGLDHLETIPVFPRPATQTPWQ
ncbi:ANTH-domain-containing protein [Thozetella sp. PMI_491]|nr:ANTH-domain-containing protein [Thozetella sp. PMI_491]